MNFFVKTLICLTMASPFVFSQEVEDSLTNAMSAVFKVVDADSASQKQSTPTQPAPQTQPAPTPAQQSQETPEVSQLLPLEPQQSQSQPQQQPQESKQQPQPQPAPAPAPQAQPKQAQAPQKKPKKEKAPKATEQDSRLYIIDKRDGQKYPYVQIGAQYWLAKNLNFATKGSICFENEGVCQKIGRHYTWSTAMAFSSKANSSTAFGSYKNHRGLCPTDWHIPSDDEWKKLRDFIVNDQNTDNVDLHLRAKKGWHNEEGYNTYGFAAQGAGIKTGWDFEDTRFVTYFWSSTEKKGGLFTKGSAYARSIYLDAAGFDSEPMKKTSFLSVRCVKDVPNYVPPKKPKAEPPKQEQPVVIAAPAPAPEPKQDVKPKEQPKPKEVAKPKEESKPKEAAKPKEVAKPKEEPKEEKLVIYGASTPQNDVKPKEEPKPKEAAKPKEEPKQEAKPKEEPKPKEQPKEEKLVIFGASDKPSNNPSANPQPAGNSGAINLNNEQSNPPTFNGNLNGQTDQMQFHF